MPIVFEEVTGEIVPEREAEPRDAPAAVTADGDDRAEKLRRQLELMRERRARLMAD